MYFNNTSEIIPYKIILKGKIRKTRYLEYQMSNLHTLRYIEKCSLKEKHLRDL